MARIAIGGFQHETNTFAPSKAGLRAFLEPGGWPALCRGAAIFEVVQGANLPVAGFIEAARARGHALLPLSWAAASPSAHVTEEAFERIVGQIVDDLAGLRDLDGVYLDLHGAMVAEHHEDGEGEVLRRVRAVVGPDLPVIVSLDLHANVTPEMVDLSDCLVAYRTYPHVDMADTGARAAALFDARLEAGAPFFKAYRKLPFLIPLPAGCTMIEPAKSLYERTESLEQGGALSVSFAAGFGPADIWHCGPAVLAYATDAAAAEQSASALYAEISAREAEFGMAIWTPEEAVAHSLARSRAASRPMVLADSQDNPGGGGNGDTVGLLAALVRKNAQGAALAILCDAEAASAAHAAGEGAEIAVPLGAKSGLPGHEPLHATYRVECLGDGRFTGTGPFYKGVRADLGPMALLSLGGVRIIVASRKLQAADQAIFRHLGVEPAEQKILALKSSVHFRADFAPIAEEILVVKAPGPNALDYSELTYRRLRPGVRLMPMGAAFGGAAGQSDEVS